MPLDDDLALWLYDFTGGAVETRPARLLPAPGDQRGLLEDELRRRQQQERVEAQALKEVLLGRAIEAVEAKKDDIRKACDMEVDTREKDGTVKTQKVRARKQEEGFDATEAPQLVVKDKDKESFSKQAQALQQAYALLIEEGKKLEKATFMRSYLDERQMVVASRREPLFTDDEIMNELYTPLVRERIVPDTFIQGKYSATQKMIDGSNEYYIKECRDKGRTIGFDGAGISKATVTLATSIANTVLAGLQTVDPSKYQSIAGSNTLTKKESAQATEIVNGVAALLTGGIDAVDGILDYRDSGDFSVSGYKGVMNNLAQGLGKIVAGCTGDMNLGLTVTDALSAGTTASSLIPEFINWRKKGGDPPVAFIIEAIGSSIASSFSATSDQTSGDTSTAWAQAGAIVGGAFSTFAKAQEKRLVESFKKGDWGAVMDVLVEAGTQAAKVTPVACKFARDYNNIDDSDKEKMYVEQQRMLKQVKDTTDNIDKSSGALATLGGEAVEQIVDKFGIKGLTPSEQEQQIKEAEKKFEEWREKKEKQEQVEREQESVASIQEKLNAEQKTYQDSLNCLGSTNPSDGDHKTIAKLIAQIERDRKIWDSVNALFGGGVGIASASATAIKSAAAEIAPPLKAAGQLLKFVANLKAAADRCEAWLKWREGRKDAESAVSPYGTAIDNFVQNQGAQFTHYTIQAAAAVINALLAAGELSPLAPAFKVAGGAVTSAAAAEDLVYKFIKQAALRRAWAETKEALDPKNRGNRKMALLVRAINPTLAKYTIAYGAMIEKSPVAITALNRVGLDRETLTRAGDKVADVKKYLETLYVDDNKVVGLLDLDSGKTKLPTPALNCKAWTLTHLLWTEKEGLADPNPPAIAAHLAQVEKLLAKRSLGKPPLDNAEIERLLALLAKLETAFRDFTPRTESKATIESAAAVVGAYADLAQSTAKAVRMEME